jgi:capsid protein
VRKFLDARWIPRGWAWVDPLKDTQAGVLAVQSGLASRSSLLAEQGEDFEDVLEQLAEEEDMADAAGVSIDPNIKPSLEPVVGSENQSGDSATASPAPSKKSGGGNRNGHVAPRLRPYVVGRGR